MKMIGNDQVSLAAESFGQPSDPPIILVMGATASMLWWPIEFCERIAAEGRFVIRFDHRDTGRSTKVPLGSAQYTIEDMADDVLSVLDGFSVEAAHFVGMSLGGLITQLIALRNPERVSSLTLIAAEPLGGEPVDVRPISPSFLEHFATMGVLDWDDDKAVAGFLRQIALLSAPPTRGIDEPMTSQRIAGEIERAGNMVSSAFNHATVDGDLKKWDLRTISQPTLVIHGAHDPIVDPENGKAIAAQVAGARLILLPDAGHELNSADLALVATAIVEHTGHPALH